MRSNSFLGHTPAPCLTPNPPTVVLPLEPVREDTEFDLFAAVEMKLSPRFRHGLSAHERGDWDAALSLYYSALNAGDDDPASLFNNIGVTCDAMGDRSFALESFENALVNDPVHWVAIYNSGTLHLTESGRDSASLAISYLETAARLHPHVIVRFNLLLARSTATPTQSRDEEMDECASLLVEMKQLRRISRSSAVKHATDYLDQRLTA